MTIQVVCPGCKKGYNLKPMVAGKRVRCKACGATIAVPGDGMAKGQAPAVPAKPSATAFKPPAPPAKAPVPQAAEMKAAPKEPTPAPMKSKAGMFALLAGGLLPVLLLCIVVYFAVYKSSTKAPERTAIHGQESAGSPG